jgi:hypothetical protein
VVGVVVVEGEENPWKSYRLLDDIVSELWRKENVTSGYCPRYRYTLIATLTLDNLYYICVDFSSNTHHRRKCATCALSAGIRRVIRRSFGRFSFMCIVRASAVVRELYVGSFFTVRWVILFRGSHSLRDLFARSLGHSLGSAFRAGVIFRWSCGRLTDRKLTPKKGQTKKLEQHHMQQWHRVPSY